MSRRSLLQIASVAAGTTSAGNVIATPDDNFARTVKSLWVTPATAGVLVTLRKGGYQIEQIDASRCTAGNWPVDVDEVWPATIQITADIQNTTNGAVVPTVQISYEPIGGTNG